MQMQIPPTDKHRWTQITQSKGRTIKYFTLEWWNGLQCFDVGDNPTEKFYAHLETIRDRLPADLLVLQDSISLHDGKLKNLDYSLASGKLCMLIDGDDGKGGLRNFALTYLGVTSFRSAASPELGLAGPRGYGDLGYDEVDLSDDGNCIHRLLFSSGIELEIEFNDFKLAWQDNTSSDNNHD